ncbi:hypothetical protein DFI_17230 (plasmid) [Deinococcus ficus]|uniref:Uncharacterized protein n=1 Tax=Deinococcus ficus TaxID=317577 RepID=A0A221T225_9DEIO|nr:hypothetical protein DFI_17230 [Deinococcus ficus]
MTQSHRVLFGALPLPSELTTQPITELHIPRSTTDLFAGEPKVWGPARSGQFIGQPLQQCLSIIQITKGGLPVWYPRPLVRPPATRGKHPQPDWAGHWILDARGLGEPTAALLTWARRGRPGRPEQTHLILLHAEHTEAGAHVEALRLFKGRLEPLTVVRT